MFDVVTSENEILALSVSFEEGMEIIRSELETCHLEEVDEFELIDREIDRA